MSVYKPKGFSAKRHSQLLGFTSMFPDGRRDTINGECLNLGTIVATRAIRCPKCSRKVCHPERIEFHTEIIDSLGRVWLAAERPWHLRAQAREKGSSALDTIYEAVGTPRNSEPKYSGWEYVHTDPIYKDGEPYRPLTEPWED